MDLFVLCLWGDKLDRVFKKFLNYKYIGSENEYWKFVTKYKKGECVFTG